MKDADSLMKPISVIATAKGTCRVFALIRTELNIWKPTYLYLSYSFKREINQERKFRNIRLLGAISSIVNEEINN